MSMAILLGLLFFALPLSVVWSLWWQLNAQLKASNHAEAGLWVAFVLPAGVGVAIGLALAGLTVSMLDTPEVSIPVALAVVAGPVLTVAFAVSRAWRKVALMLALQASAAALGIALFVALSWLSYTTMWEDF